MDSRAFVRDQARADRKQGLKRNRADFRSLFHKSTTFTPEQFDAFINDCYTLYLDAYRQSFKRPPRGHQWLPTKIRAIALADAQRGVIRSQGEWRRSTLLRRFPYKVYRHLARQFRSVNDIRPVHEPDGIKAGTPVLFTTMAELADHNVDGGPDTRPLKPRAWKRFAMSPELHRRLQKASAEFNTGDAP